MFRVTGSGTSGKPHHFCPSAKTGENKTFMGKKKTKPGTSFFLNSDIEKRYFPRLHRGFHPYLAVSRQREIVCIKLGLRAGKTVSKGACCQGQ